MPKGFSLNSIIRICPQCHKEFRPMTDKKWDWVYAAHTMTRKCPHVQHMPTFTQEESKK